MSYDQILALVLVALVLLGGLVSLGLGHRRWNIAMVVAGFLVLLAAGTYLYLAARLAARERAWARRIDDYRIKIAKAIDDQTPGKDGFLQPENGGPLALAKLRDERDRWQRGLERVETWRGRIWQNASFQPPRDDAATGKVELAAEGNAEGFLPINPGAHVFLFDAIPLADGGAYIGEFLVKDAAFDPVTKRHTLTVTQTAPRDAYDAKVLKLPHDDVLVFESLPVDRWLAFYTSPKAAGAAPLPEPAKDADQLARTLGEAGEVPDRVRQFIEAFGRHDEEVPEDEWEAAAAEARETPGTLWAGVTFLKRHSFAGDAAVEDAGNGPKQVFEPDEKAEFDLQTAVALRDAADGTVRIDRVFRRRALTDALTLLHGSLAGPGAGADGGVRADGAATLLRMLKEEIEALERSTERLRNSSRVAADNIADERRVAAELERDLESWRRDAREATDLAQRFERELKRKEDQLDSVEDAIVTQGREFAALTTRLADAIDRAAPPPQRRTARP